MNQGEILIYQNQEGNIKIDVRLEEETFWLSQAQMAQLFGKARTTVTEHIQNVFKEGELDKEVVSRNFRLTTQHAAIADKVQENNIKLLQSRRNNFSSLQSKIATRNTVSYLGNPTIKVIYCKRF
jgi:hypothetical protein